MIRAARFAAPALPEGLGGAPGDLPWLGMRLAEGQRAAAAEAGIALEEQAAGQGPWVLIREDAAVTGPAIAALVQRGRREGRDLVWRTGGRAGALARDLCLRGDPEAPLLAFLAGDGPPDPARLAGAEVVEFDPKERLFPIPVPPTHFSSGRLQLPLTDRLVLPVGHWTELMWANLLGLAPTLWRRLLGRRAPVAVARLLWAAIRGFTLDPARLAARLSRRGRKVRVHPSAVVEASWLGDGVSIGAGAIVRGSVLGPGAAVEEQALVEFSALAEGARVQRKALVKYSVLGPRCAFGGIVQLGVIGPDAVVKMGAVLMDMAFGAPVRVRAQGRLVDAPFGLLGVCVGPGTTVASGVQVAPGRALPAGLIILSSGAELVRSVPEGLGGVVSVRDGRLVPQ